MLRSLRSLRPTSLIRLQSTWAHVPAAPPDKILGLGVLYQLDRNPNKINLGVGAYRDENGRPWILPSIRMAEDLLRRRGLEKEYSPILGSAAFIEEVQKMLFGHDINGRQLLSESRVVTAQGLSGTGSLRVLAEFVSEFNASRHLKLPDPTWSNHIAIVRKAGLIPSTYRYYDFEKNTLDFDGFVEDLHYAEPGSVILLHLCCHNPTGIDATLEQWDKIIDALSERQLVPLLDMAYQGFKSGDPVEDLKVLFKFNEAVTHGRLSTFLLSQSFAKNMGLYGERVGSLSVVCQDEREAYAVRSQLAKIIRPMYSSPPTHGSKLVELVLSNPYIYRQWLKDVRTMTDRLNLMRRLLYNKLTGEYSSSLDWQHLLEQRGMFCYTGLNSDQVSRLREKSVYLTDDGRMSVAGIRKDNVDYLARSIDDVTHNCIPPLSHLVRDRARLAI